MNDYFIMRAKEAPTTDIPVKLPLSDCKEGQLHVLLLPDGRKAILICQGEALFAYLAVCPHMGGDLTRGSYCAKSNRISCCWHGYRYDAVSGNFCENSNIESLKMMRIKSPHFDPDKQVHYRLQPLSVHIDDGQVSVDYKGNS